MARKPRITDGPDLAALAQQPGGGTRGLVAAHRELIEQARQMGHGWEAVAAALSRTCGQPFSGEQVRKAYSRQVGAGKRKRQQQGAAPPARQPVTAKPTTAGASASGATPRFEGFLEDGVDG
ncbi:MAG: hypothetical protein P8011_00095 [Acidihalobacter sp.]|uniref:hypothetical protein n=1 Tax=Acidihalobacter sp. TaxID=1872108 RepID=UPI00307EC40B